MAAKETIEREAREAAAAGKTLNEACPYQFGSEEGIHFVAVYFLSQSSSLLSGSKLDQDTLFLFVKSVLTEAQQ